MTAAQTASAHARISTLSTLMKVMVIGSKPPALASKRSERMPAVTASADMMLPQAVTAAMRGADHKTLADN